MITIETTLRIYDADAGVSLEIAPDPDGYEGDTLILRPSDEKSQGYFGGGPITMEKSFALKVGEALIRAAREK